MSCSLEEIVLKYVNMCHFSELFTIVQVHLRMFASFEPTQLILGLLHEVDLLHCFQRHVPEHPYKFVLGFCGSEEVSALCECLHCPI